MKNDQLDETNPNMSSIHMTNVSNISNMELLASFDKMNSEIIWENNSDYFPTSPKVFNNALEHPCISL